MYKAASIAEQHALPHGTLKCWHYVKEALVAAGSVSSYPQTVYAKDAGHELVERYGFVRLPVRSPRARLGRRCVRPTAVTVAPAMWKSAWLVDSPAITPCSRPAALPFLGAYAPRHVAPRNRAGGHPGHTGIVKQVRHGLR